MFPIHMVSQKSHHILMLDKVIFSMGHTTSLKNIMAESYNITTSLKQKYYVIMSDTANP